MTPTPENRLVRIDLLGDLGPMSSHAYTDLPKVRAWGLLVPSEFRDGDPEITFLHSEPEAEYVKPFDTFALFHAELKQAIDVQDGDTTVPDIVYVRLATLALAPHLVVSHD